LSAVRRRQGAAQHRARARFALGSAPEQTRAAMAGRGGMRARARLLAIALVAAAAAAARAQLGIPTGLLQEATVTEVRLAEIPGCTPEGGSQKPSNYLRSGISGGCVLERVLSPDEAWAPKGGGENLLGLPPGFLRTGQPV
jgi:hypothetical protein